MNLDDILLGQISQSREDSIVQVYGVCGVVGIRETESGRAVGGEGEWIEELVLHGYRVSAWEDEKLLEVARGDGCTTRGM